MRNRTDLFGEQRHYRQRLAIQGQELHLVSTPLMDQHHRSNVTTAQAMLWQIHGEYDGIEFFVWQFHAAAPSFCCRHFSTNAW